MNLEKYFQPSNHLGEPKLVHHSWLLNKMSCLDIVEGNSCGAKFLFTINFVLNCCRVLKVKVDLGKYI